MNTPCLIAGLTVALTACVLLAIIIHSGKGAPGFLASNAERDNFGGSETDAWNDSPAGCNAGREILIASDHFSQCTEPKSLVDSFGRLDAATRCSELTDGAEAKLGASASALSEDAR